MLANFMERSLWRNQLVSTEARELGLPVLEVGGDEEPDELLDRCLIELGLA